MRAQARGGAIDRRIIRRSDARPVAADRTPGESHAPPPDLGSADDTNSRISRTRTFCGMPVSCGVTPTVRAFSSTLPESARRRPSKISSVVVLPAPLAPSSATTSPFATANETPSTAICLPYLLRRLRSCTRAHAVSPLFSSDCISRTCSTNAALPIGDRL